MDADFFDRTQPITQMCAIINNVGAGTFQASFSAGARNNKLNVTVKDLEKKRKVINEDVDSYNANAINRMCQRLKSISTLAEALQSNQVK